MISPDLRQKLERHGHEHLLDLLVQEAFAELARELERINLEELAELYQRRHQKDVLPERERIAALPKPALDQAQREEFRRRGEQAFRRGEVAFLLVAGGQGTRLGFNDPKGMFPIGPISKKTLFQLHAEKIVALKRRFGPMMPLLIMTSPATDAATRKFFEANAYFSLMREHVWTFCQGTMPALDLETGRLLLEPPGRLCLSPNGHGGTLTGLAESGLLDRLEQRGIRTIYYFQVDNPLVNLSDYVFVGRHLAENAEVSSKVLPKTGPTEKVGNFALVDGRCSMIEYSDLPHEWAHETDEQGELKFWAGNPAIHLFDVAFLRKITQEAERLPWHLARKKVPHLDASGQLITPSAENALKFERFIFDVLPQAERWTVHPTPREEEFAPVKNAEGVDSPATAQQLMINQAARWLREAGVDVPLDEKGNSTVRVEISPIFALDPEDLRRKVKNIGPVRKKRYFG